MTALARRNASSFVACLVLATVGTGCALRATTDFGPQSASSTRSITAGPEGLPGGVSGVSGPGGDAVGLRNSGGPYGGAGSSTSPEGGTAGTGGMR